MFNPTVRFIFFLRQSMEKTCCRNSKLATNYCPTCPHLSNLISYWRENQAKHLKWWPTCNKWWLSGSCHHFSLGTGEMMRWRPVVPTWPPWDHTASMPAIPAFQGNGYAHDGPLLLSPGLWAAQRPLHSVQTAGVLLVYSMMTNFSYLLY